MVLSKEKKLITDLMITGEYDLAREELLTLVEELPDNMTLQVLLARCNIALDNLPEAEKIYNRLCKISDPAHIAVKSEADLVLGRYKQALAELEAGLAGNAPDAEELFLVALIAYKNGNIIKTIDYMNRAVEQDLEWEDELPINILVSHTLVTQEYHDFENIYLDVCEQIDEGHDQTNNRWFAINMPVYDFYTSDDSKQVRASKLLEQISPGASKEYLNKGKEKLESILMDLAASQTDARFGLEAMKQLKENHHKELAELVLAMLLEHLAQFSELMGLEPEFVKKSQLQELVKLLPYRLAVIAMVLFTITHPIETVKPQENLNSVLAGLIAASLTGFYLEIDQLKSSGPK